MSSNFISFRFQNGSNSTASRNDIEMQQPLNIETNGEVNPNEESRKKGKRNSFDFCHTIYDFTSLLLTLTLTIIGSIYIDAKIDYWLFSLVITEMQIFGLILKSTYYLYGRS